MSKKVIFDPEDFDKPQKKGVNKKLAWGVGICGALALIGIGGYAFLAPETEKTADDTYMASSSNTQSANKGEELSAESVSDTAKAAIAVETDGSEEERVSDEKSLKTGDVPEESPSLKSNPSQGVESIDKEAMKVIRGDYGDGNARKNRLGERYNTIQKRVNELKQEGVF